MSRHMHLVAAGLIAHPLRETRGADLLAGLAAERVRPS